MISGCDKKDASLGVALTAVFKSQIIDPPN
jgi:hypothetical protein